MIAGIGVTLGVVGGFVLARFAGGFLSEVALPGAVPLLGAAAVLVAAAVLASLMPASRAAKVDVMQALRTD